MDFLRYNKFRMKLTVLMDNNTYIDMYYLGEPAVSYFIEDGNTRILFDTAYSDAYIKNAKAMGIDLDDVDKIVLSHGHNDHSGGLRYLNARKTKLIAHPDAFDYKLNEGLEVSSPLSRNEVSDQYDLTLSKKPLQISDNIFFLGEIPTYFDFEKRYALGKTRKDNKMIDDYLYDDSAIVYRSDKGLFVITGCSHSGICSIMEHAKKVCSDERIYGVIGGYHLFEIDDRLHKTIEYFKENKVELIYPCHCVSLKAKIEMGRILNIREVGVGLVLQI